MRLGAATLVRCRRAGAATLVPWRPAVELGAATREGAEEGIEGAAGRVRL
jgi:hypothetical protein